MQSMFGNYQNKQHSQSNQITSVRNSQQNSYTSRQSKIFDRNSSRVKHEPYSQEETKIPEIQTSGRISVQYINTQNDSNSRLGTNNKTEITPRIFENETKDNLKGKLIQKNGISRQVGSKLKKAIENMNQL